MGVSSSIFHLAPVVIHTRLFALKSGHTIFWGAFFWSSVAPLNVITWRIFYGLEVKYMFQRFCQCWERWPFSQFSGWNRPSNLDIYNFSGTTVHTKFLVLKWALWCWLPDSIKNSRAYSRKRDFFAIFWGLSDACFSPLSSVVEHWLVTQEAGVQIPVWAKVLSLLFYTFSRQFIYLVARWGLQ